MEPLTLWTWIDLLVVPFSRSSLLSVHRSSLNFSVYLLENDCLKSCYIEPLTSLSGFMLSSGQPGHVPTSDPLQGLQGGGGGGGGGNVVAGQLQAALPTIYQLDPALAAAVNSAAHQTQQVSMTVEPLGNVPSEIRTHAKRSLKGFYYSGTSEGHVTFFYCDRLNLVKSL